MWDTSGTQSHHFGPTFFCTRHREDARLRRSIGPAPHCGQVQPAFKDIEIRVRKLPAETEYERLVRRLPVLPEKLTWANRRRTGTRGIEYYESPMSDVRQAALNVLVVDSPVPPLRSPPGTTPAYRFFQQSSPGGLTASPAPPDLHANCSSTRVGIDTEFPRRSDAACATASRGCGWPRTRSSMGMAGLRRNWRRFGQIYSKTPPCRNSGCRSVKVRYHPRI